jgi:hypothetical protein
MDHNLQAIANKLSAIELRALDSESVLWLLNDFNPARIAQAAVKKDVTNR